MTPDLPHEIELKLACTPDEAKAIAQAPLLRSIGATEKKLVSTYFDTPDLALHGAGFTLRVRDTGDGHIQTAKAESAATAGLFARPEWERAVPDARPVIDATAGPIETVLDGRTLAPRFVTAITRAIWDVPFEGATIEVALDRGTIRAGDLQDTVCELELELKAGRPAALFALARALGGTTPPRLAVQTKAERGHALAAGPRHRAWKAEDIQLDADGTTGAAFAAIAHACLRQFRLNEALLANGGDADALHQARVALRRLRSAFALFKDLFEGDETAARLRAELRWLAGMLGDVRNLDVLIAAGRAPVPPLAQARAAALATAESALGSSRARTLLLDLAEWIAAGDWRLRATDPILPCAAALLDRQRRKVRKRGRHFADLDDPARHELRIAAKKLRYAAEFFAGLWAGKEARHRRKDFLGALEDLQDQLGLLNDAATAPGVYAALGLDGPLVLDSDAHARVCRKAEAALERLKDAKRFWR